MGNTIYLKEDMPEYVAYCLGKKRNGNIGYGAPFRLAPSEEFPLQLTLSDEEAEKWIRDESYRGVSGHLHERRTLNILQHLYTLTDGREVRDPVDVVRRSRLEVFELDADRIKPVDAKQIDTLSSDYAAREEELRHATVGSHASSVYRCFGNEDNQLCN